jgi:hypothetical protein
MLSDEGLLMKQSVPSKGLSTTYDIFQLHTSLESYQ